MTRKSTYSYQVASRRLQRTQQLLLWMRRSGCTRRTSVATCQAFAASPSCTNRRSFRGPSQLQSLRQCTPLDRPFQVTRTKKNHSDHTWKVWSSKNFQLTLQNVCILNSRPDSPDQLPARLPWQTQCRLSWPTGLWLSQDTALSCRWGSSWFSWNHCLAHGAKRIVKWAW